MSESRVVITAQAEQAIREFNRFRAEAIGSLKKVSDWGGKVGGVLASIGAGAAVAAVGAWIKGAINAGDAAGKLAQKAGIAVNQVAGLELAYQQAGLGGDALTMSMSKLSKGMVDGSKALDAMGIRAKGVDGTFRGTRDVLYEVADRFAGMSDGARKTALALELFGKTGADMIPLLNGGADALREMDAMAAKLGLTIEAEAAAKAEKFNDTLDLVQMGGQGVARGLASELLPTLSSLAGSFLESMTSGDGLRRTAEVLATGLKLLFTVAVGVGAVFSSVGQVIGGFAAMISNNLTGAISALSKVAKGDFSGAWDEVKNTVIMTAHIANETASTVGDTWTEASKTITNAWDAGGNATVDAMVKVRSATKLVETDAKAAAKALKAEADAYKQLLKDAQDRAKLRQQEDDGIAAYMLAQQEGYNAAVAGSRAAVVAAQAEYDQQGKSKSQIAEMTLLTLESAQAKFLEGSAGYEAATKQIEAQKELIAILRGGEARDVGSDVTKAKELLDIMVAVDDATRSAAAGMAASFGKVGDAIGSLTTSLSGYAKAQAAIAAQLAIATKDANKDPGKLQKANAVAAAQAAQAQIKSYGDMASAAKGFFKENSTGYKVMENAEKAFRAAEMAMALQAMAKKIFFKEGEVAANYALNATKLTGEAATSAASTGLAATEASAWGITAVVKALASLPFPANLAAGAATLAAVVAIGAKMLGGIGGSGGGRSAADVQRDQGTGTVFGDSKAKSDSISKTIELLEKNSASLLPISRGMLSALRSIEASMKGLTNLLVRTPGLTEGTNMGIQEGVVSKGMNGFNGDASRAIKDIPIYGWIANALQKVWGKTTQTIIDSGLSFGGSVRGLQAGQGINQYASVDSTRSSWFGLKKSTSNSIQTQGLSPELSAQFGLIFTDVEKALSAAAVGLGLGANHVASVLDALTIDVTSISLKGLTGDALTEAINGVISKTMDEMAMAVLPQMDAFRRVGEGYAETVIRIASNYATLDSALQAIGTTFGATGLGSLAARERLLSMVGGIDKFNEQTASFAENFLTEAERLAPVQKYVTEQMAALGYAGVKTRDDFKGAVLELTSSGALLTEKGAETFAALMRIEGAFASVVPAAEKAADAVDQTAIALQVLRDQSSGLLSAVDDAFEVLSRVVAAEKKRLSDAHAVTMKALQQRIDTETAALAKSKALADALSGALDSARLPGQAAADRANAQEQIRGALAAARAGGSLPEANSLRQALSILSQDSSDLFATMHDFQLDFYRTRSDIAELGKYADSAVSVEEKTIALLQQQKEVVELAYQEEILRLDEIVADAKREVDLLKGIDTRLLTIVQALANIGGAVSAANANPLLASTSGITKAYQSALGRAPDEKGLAYWQDMAGRGMSTSEIVGLIETSAEAKAQGLFRTILGREGDTAGVNYWTKALSGGLSMDAAKAMFMNSDEFKNRVPGFALGGDHAGGARIVGEVGPELEVTGPSRITSTRNLMESLRSPGEANRALLEELRATRRENQAMREMMEDHLYAIAKYGQETASILDGAVNGGVPIMTVEAT